MKLSELQPEHAEWQLRNFGDGPAWHTHLGVMEELGELCRAVLKPAQQIRGTSDEWVAKGKDAVADTLIFLCGHYTRTTRKIGACACGFRPLAGVQRMAGAPEYEDYELVRQAMHAASAQIVHADDVILPLAQFCTARGWDLDQIVTETWQREVSKRDWRASPRNGLTE